MFSLEICILFIFSLMQLSRGFDFDDGHWRDIVRIWTHIKLTSFCYKENALTNWHPKQPLSIYYTYSTLPLTTIYPLSVCQNIYWGIFSSQFLGKGFCHTVIFNLTYKNSNVFKFTNFLFKTKYNTVVRWPWSVMLPLEFFVTF